MDRFDRTSGFQGNFLRSIKPRAEVTSRLSAYGNLTLDEVGIAEELLGVNLKMLMSIETRMSERASLSSSLRDGNEVWKKLPPNVGLFLQKRREYGRSKEVGRSTSWRRPS